MCLSTKNTGCSKPFPDLHGLLLCCCTEENTKPPGSKCIALIVIQIPAQSAGLWMAVIFALGSSSGSLTGVRRSKVQKFCFIQLSSHPTHLHWMGDTAISGRSQNTKTTKCLGWTFIYCNRTVIFQYEILVKLCRTV